MSVGFLTNNFVSPFNPNRDTLMINNVDTGIPVDNISISPNDSYTIQETGFGTIKTMWPHLSLSGEVQLFIKFVSETDANKLNTLVQASNTNYFIAFAGYVFKAESIDISIKPNAQSINRLDVTLSFYGQLPYSSPVFRPGFSTKTTPEGRLIMSSDIATIPTASRVGIIPLPGNSIRNREDTILVLSNSTNTNTNYKVVSDIKDYTSGNLGNIPITSTLHSHNSLTMGILDFTDGEDEIAIASRSGDTITVNYIRVRENNAVPNHIRSKSINIPNITNMYISDSYLYVWSQMGYHYRLQRVMLKDKDTVIENLQDSAGISGYQAPGAMYYGLEDKRNISIVDNINSVRNIHKSFLIPKGIFNYIPGVNVNTLTSIHYAQKVEDNKIVLFPAGLSTAKEAVLYVVMSFKKYNEEFDLYTEPRVLTYKLGELISNPEQMAVYSGIFQVNTAICDGHNLYMTTEAYTDYYKERNILCFAQSSVGNTYYAYKGSTDIKIRQLVK